MADELKEEVKPDNIFLFDEKFKQIAGEVDRLRADKEEIIASYNNKIKDLEDVVEKKKQEIADIEIIFREQFRGRIRSLDEKEAENLRYEQKVNDNDRKVNAKMLEFDKRQAEYDEVFKSESARLEALIDKNAAILKDNENARNDIEYKLRENKSILDRIVEERAQLNSEQAKTGRVNAELDKKIDSFKQTVAQVDEREAKSTARLAEIQRVYAQNIAKEKEIDSEIQELKESRDQMKDELAVLKAKQAEVLALMEEPQKQIVLLQELSEKVNQQKVANQAKEIQLNAKNQNLLERENNLKIIEKANAEKMG